MNKDKKKALVLGALGTALIAVGAFQFIPKGGGSDPAAKPAKAATKTPESPSNRSASGTPTNSTSKIESNPGRNPTGDLAKKDVDPQEEMLRNMGKAPLAKRDPFAPQGVIADPTPVVVNQPAPPVNRDTTARPDPVLGRIPPFDPTNRMTPIPGGPTGPIGIKDATPLRQEGEFAYTMKGVIVGRKPMAVFEDDSGNQRLVPLGGSIDRDTKVVGIEKGKVRIRHRGKDKTLNLPEGP